MGCGLCRRRFRSMRPWVYKKVQLLLREEENDEELIEKDIEMKVMKPEPIVPSLLVKSKIVNINQFS